MYIISLHFIDLIIFRTFITNRVRGKKALNYHWSLFTTRHVPTRAQLVGDMLPPSLWDVSFGFFKCPFQAACANIAGAAAHVSSSLICGEGLSEGRQLFITLLHIQHADVSFVPTNWPGLLRNASQEIERRLVPG